LNTDTPARRIISYSGKIHLIAADHDLQKIDFSEVRAFGFDTETKPSFKKGDDFKTALLQLATDEDAYILRLHYLTRFERIKAVLENPAVLKVGVAIAHDLKQLQRIFPFRPEGFVELQKVAKEKGLKNMGLKGMAEEVLGAHLIKSTKMTNWENRQLTEQQLRYAATDAWIGLELYRKIT
jgi:ribonuclease D